MGVQILSETTPHLDDSFLQHLIQVLKLAWFLLSFEHIPPPASGFCDLLISIAV